MKTMSRTIQSVCLLAAMLPCAIGSAQCIGGQCAIGAPPAVVRVVNTLGPCRSYGSGTVVHDDGRTAVVLSCAHLFREGTGRVQVVFPDGRSLVAQVKAIDPTWDLSALEIQSPGVSPIDVSATVPLPGQRLQSCGFGPNGVYRCNAGTVQGYANGPNTSTHETLCLSGSARDGDSGGPVLNQQGELVGVLWGTDGRTVHATYCGRIRKFLASLLPNLGVLRPPPNTSPAKPQSPPAPGTDRLDAIAEQLAQSAEDQKQRDSEMASRVGRLEGLAEALKTLRDRLEGSGASTSSELPPRAREAVGAAATSGLTDMLISALPRVLTALGWTTPPSLAAILALRVGLSIVRRRVKRKRLRGARKTLRLKPLNDQYAAQLNEVYALSGRSPTADATLGREYDRQLREMEAAADDTTSRWAHNLRQRVADRFLRIHDASPLPAEPIQEAPDSGLQAPGLR